MVHVGQPATIMETIQDYLFDNYNYLKSSVMNIGKDLYPKVNSLFIPLGVYLTVYCVISFMIYKTSIYRRQLSKSEHFVTKAKRVLVVIAHPDDECMFFGPVILRLTKRRDCNVYLMCLSNGNADRKGHLRKRELFESCKMLNIPPEHVVLSCSSLRCDGFEEDWKSEQIASLVLDHVEQYDIDTVVTFDQQGVSGHPNHISVFKSMNYLTLRSWLPANCKIFILDSVNIFRKYSGAVDYAISLFTSKNVFILSPSERNVVRSSMQMHQTQLTWYRKLYLYFSRYTLVNTLTELPRYQEYSH